MSKKEQLKPEKAVSLPGLQLEEFKAAVDTLASSIQRLTFMLFVGRPTHVRFIGNVSEFSENYLKRLQRDFGASAVADALEEVRRYVQALLQTQKVSGARDFLVSFLYDHPSRQVPPDRKADLNQLVEEKLNYASKHLLNDAITKRVERLVLGTGSALHDLDAELVSERYQNLDGKTSAQPFIRVRVRYSDEATFGFPFIFFDPSMTRGGPLPKTFDLECDETDIDLMILRLRAAKDILLAAVTKQSQPKLSGD
ncbi:MAG TPA: hypothetical protein VFE58_17285 [Tepidisphaeraceae bacterium]|nr:hypothetical protein [Tepidisphaeraceae bacterium]